MAKIVPEPVPYLPPVWDNADAAAFQALAQGKATEAQDRKSVV